MLVLLKVDLLNFGLLSSFLSVGFARSLSDCSYMWWSSEGFYNMEAGYSCVNCASGILWCLEDFHACNWHWLSSGIWFWGFDVFKQHIRKYLPELLSLTSELWSSFSLPASTRPSRGFPVCLFFSLQVQVICTCISCGLIARLIVLIIIVSTVILFFKLSLPLLLRYCI